MDWEKLFRATASGMRNKFDEIRAAIEHKGLKGSANEHILSEWLEYYLPRSIGVCTGEVIDSHGGRTKQQDVIAFDSLTTPKFFESEKIRLIPVESVYSLFEVKAYLNKGEIERAFENMLSAKALIKSAYFPEVNQV